MTNQLSRGIALGNLGVDRGEGPSQLKERLSQNLYDLIDAAKNLEQGNNIALGGSETPVRRILLDTIAIAGTYYRTRTPDHDTGVQTSGDSADLCDDLVSFFNRRPNLDIHTINADTVSTRSLELMSAAAAVDTAVFKLMGPSRDTRFIERLIYQEMIHEMALDFGEILVAIENGAISDGESDPWQGVRLTKEQAGAIVAFSIFMTDRMFRDVDDRIVNTMLGIMNGKATEGADTDSALNTVRVLLNDVIGYYHEINTQTVEDQAQQENSTGLQDSSRRQAYTEQLVQEIRSLLVLKDRE